MEKQRFVLFLAISAAIVIGHTFLMRWLGLDAPPPQPVAQQADDAAPGGEATDAPDAAAGGADQAPEPEAADEAEQPAEAEIPRRWLTLGSLADDSPYRMLVMFTSAGAAVERIELAGDRYNELDTRSGYLGHLAETDAPGGVEVRAVGAGTPAAIAGIEVGDVINTIDGVPVISVEGFWERLAETKPDDEIEISITRDGKAARMMALLSRHPLQLIRPEREHQPLDFAAPDADPSSFRLGLFQVGDETVADGADELNGLDLLSGDWEVVEEAGNDEVIFRRRLPMQGLELRKRYRLAQNPEDDGGDERNTRAYHLTLNVEIANTGEQAKNVAYQIYGPSGLPTEGWWYANKITPGLREVVSWFSAGYTDPLAAQDVYDDEEGLQPDGSPKFIGIDGQYFAVVMIPQQDEMFAQWEPLVYGPKPDEKQFRRLGNVSFRLVSAPQELAPGGEALNHEILIFAGPKRPDLLAKYGPEGATLETLVDYGWFDFVAVPMLWILHTFYAIVRNYGIAIILLTCLVRGCMFPLSKKQALSAQKMQELKPEMDRINAKYKGKNEERAKATQELFRKHNYNPLGGCLLMFIQLPIFIGLYRSLMIDVELRQAPLLSESIRWCSNLGAPDMLFYWGDWPLPAFLIGETGWLGPYFNLLPLFTVALFLWQQKMFMPPPTDEQTALTQKMMRYMMIVVAFMFFKVASGLCIYFIASSIWGIAERKLLPKTSAGQTAKAEAQAEVKAGKDATATNRPARRKKPRGK